MAILLSTFFTAFVSLALIHIVAMHFFLYETFDWFDIPMHFLGGVCIALCFALLPFFHIYLPKRYTTITVYLCVVLLVGVVWEIFEYMTGLSGVAVQNDFVFDTVLDLVMDVLGGVVGYGMVRIIKNIEYT